MKPLDYSIVALIFGGLALFTFGTWLEARNCHNRGGDLYKSVCVGPDGKVMR